MITLKELAAKEELSNLYDLPTLTFEGCTTDEENLNYLYNWLKNNNTLKSEDLHLYLIKGKTMNEVYELKNKNRYRQRVNIIAIDYTDVDITKLITKRFELGRRWLSDIVDNNERRN